MKHILIALLLISTLTHASGILEVDWSSVKTLDEQNTTTNKRRSRLTVPESLKEQILNIEMPVYFPKDKLNSKDMSIVTDTNFYAVTIKLDNAYLMISGDKTYQAEITTSKANMKKAIEGYDRKYIVSEGSVNIDFRRHGVNYMLTVECDKPQTDKRCKNSTFLKSEYKKLVVIGGKR